MSSTTYGVDIAKSVMQVYWVDGDTGEIGQRAVKRSQLSRFFARRPAGRVVMEACGSSHHWARTLAPLGHEVRLVHARHVKPYVRGNKNDVSDAQAIWSAAHACRGFAGYRRRARISRRCCRYTVRERSG